MISTALSKESACLELFEVLKEARLRCHVLNWMAPLFAWIERHRWQLEQVQ